MSFGRRQKNELDFLTAPADYIQVRSMTFAPSDNGRKCLNVTILDDSLVERRESFMLTITTSDPAVSLSRNEATVTIIDNDRKLYGLYYTWSLLKACCKQLLISLQKLLLLLSRPHTLLERGCWR